MLKRTQDRVVSQRATRSAGRRSDACVLAAQATASEATVRQASLLDKLTDTCLSRA